MRLIPGIVLAALLCGSASADDLRLPAVLGDHMVVQRDATTSIWGWAAPGTEVWVTPSWGDDDYETVAADDGTWSVEIQTPGAGGPHAILVIGDEDSIELTDILSGDVWICSGQSNMQWALHNTQDGPKYVEAASNPNLRLFNVANQIAFEEQDDCKGSWSVCSPATANGFSAVGYHFGSALQRELDVPIGLIGTNWGGTRAEAWTSSGTIQAGFSAFHDDLAKMAELREGGGDEPSLSKRQASWWRKLETTDAGMTGGWMNADYVADDGWAKAVVPGQWKDFGEGGFDGCLWYRGSVDVPEAWVGSEMVLEIGPVDDMDLTWFNGALVGESRGDGAWSTPRAYTIPAGTARAGKNPIAVCAVDSGGAGLLGNDAMRLRLAANEAGESAVPLDGDWRYRRGASLGDLGPFPRSGWMTQHRASALFNGMIAPLLPYTIKGAIWYQGESNRARYEQYRRLFPAMITDWRTRWGVGDFPFYFVQLAPFGYGGDTGELALLREAQTMTLDLANTGMAVTMDIGDPADIHPRDKFTVGDRLAKLAFAKTYGRDVACEGPTYAGVEREGDSLRVRFDHADGLSSGDAPPACFTIAGADRVFHPATARIDGTTVVLRSPAVAEPVAVRFGWGASDETHLWNAAGLPAGSFRSDTWE